jgi:phage protein D
MGGVDITNRFNERLTALDLVLHDGHKNDTMSLTLDDRDFAIEAPPTDALLYLEMGYAETGLVFMGTYSVDQIEVTGPPYKMGISARAANQKSTQKEHRTKPYEKKTLGEIMKEIADRHGLKSYVSPELASFKYPYLQQTEESDWHFGNRLSYEHDALFSVKNGMLFFVAHGDSVSASGLSMPTITLTLPDLIQYQASASDRPKHLSARASWHDRSHGKSKLVSSDFKSTGKSQFMQRHLRPSKDLAKASADAKMKALQRAEGSVMVMIEGDPTVQAEGKLILSTGRSVLDGEWLIKNARHHLDQAGYRTTIDGESKAGKTSGKSKAA